MTRFPDDPEVRDDLRFRDDSQGDTSRSSLVTCECGCLARAHDQTTGACRECACKEYARATALTWSPPPIVERWPCTGCTALVDMTRDAIDLHAMFNRQLERRRERPLPKRIPCATCKARDEELEQARRRPHEQRQIPLDTERPETAGKGRP